MLRRYLKETAASPDEIERMPFADLIRTGNANGLLRGGWPDWRRFRENAGPREPYLRRRRGGLGRRRNPGISGRGRTPVRRIAPAARMRRSARIDLPDDHRRLVLKILAAHLPQGGTAWVFGS